MRIEMVIHFPLVGPYFTWKIFRFLSIIKNLQTLLDKFSLYCDTWKMKVNVDETKVVVFSKGRLPRNLIFNYNGTSIEIVKDFNFLGIYFIPLGVVSFK
jgi:hypothetical protein